MRVGVVIEDLLVVISDLLTLASVAEQEMAAREPLFLPRAHCDLTSAPLPPIWLVPEVVAVVGMAVRAAHFIACRGWLQPSAHSMATRPGTGDTTLMALIPVKLIKTVPAVRRAVMVGAFLVRARLSCIHVLLAETSAAMEVQQTRAAHT